MTYKSKKGPIKLTINNDTYYKATNYAKRLFKDPSYFRVTYNQAKKKNNEFRLNQFLLVSEELYVKYPYCHIEGELNRGELESLYFDISERFKNDYALARRVSELIPEYSVYRIYQYLFCMKFSKYDVNEKLLHAMKILQKDLDATQH